MRTRMRPLLILRGKDKWKEVFAVQVYCRGKWSWLTEAGNIIKHETREAAERERAEMRKRPDPALAA